MPKIPFGPLWTPPTGEWAHRTTLETPERAGAMLTTAALYVGKVTVEQLTTDDVAQCIAAANECLLTRLADESRGAPQLPEDWAALSGKVAKQLEYIMSRCKDNCVMRTGYIDNTFGRIALHTFRGTVNSRVMSEYGDKRVSGSDDYWDFSL